MVCTTSNSSLTDVPADGLGPPIIPDMTDDPGASAILQEKKPDLLENLEDADWQHDPENPRNWPFAKKWTTTAVVSLYTFVATKYNISNETIVALTLSIFLISFGIAPLFLAPLSEMYGRKWILNLGKLITIGFNLRCAFSPTTGALLAFRFLSGISGSTANALGPLIGPGARPVIGGFITETIGINMCIGGLASAVGIPFLRETYAPLIQLRRAKKTADPEKLTLDHPVVDSSKLHYSWINLSRPAVLLFCSPVCFLLSLMYGIYFLMFATFSSLFAGTYGFTTGTGGLAYLGLGVGFIAATAFSARSANGVYIHLAKKNGGKGEPEMRIPPLILGSLIVPIGLFWYGWSAEAKIHWIMPIIGSGIFGFGMTSTYLPMQLYLVDAFQFAASALSAASVFRYLLGFAFPLFGQQMFKALGMGGGNSLLGGLAIILGIPL
ncbi:major facilitator superfamily domain-containing protein [Mycena albidolilacea]|uniref:Major facilitator superfamily domain-containing protein n=1 Tax=Mycena albidolilacea TaxID=1033008 RepID=A0AAD7F4T9_9AGAR|nr:major facilitator superfamily domain-containing protein [Mycena albidolilacea]